MKAVLKKGSVSLTGSLKSARPVSAAKPAPANPYKLAETGGKSNSTVWIVVVIIAVAMVGMILIFSAGRGQENGAVVAQQPVVQPTPAPTPAPVTQAASTTTVVAGAAPVVTATTNQAPEPARLF